MTDQQTPAPPAEQPKRKRQPRPPSRPKRWGDAIAKAQQALDSIGLEPLQDALQELREVQEEYESWKDNLPENLANSALGEKLEAICNLEIDGIVDELESALDDVRDKVSEAEGVDLPRGFGKD